VIGVSVFNQTFVEAQAGGTRAWTLAFSLAAQSIAVCAAVVASLVFGLELPIDQLMRQALIFVPPPPPPARPELPKSQPAIVRPARFQTDALQAPRVIPNQVAMIEDGHAPDTLAGIGLAGANGVAGGVPGGVLNGVLGVPGLDGNLLPPAPLRVGGRVLAARLLLRVAPVYPTEAIEQDISGSVFLEATINVQGQIRQLKVLSGDALLADAAVAAVHQWRYRPTQLNGNAVEVISQIELIFALRAPEEDAPADPKEKKKSPKSR